MSNAARRAVRVTGEDKFRVTKQMVTELFFTHEESANGKVPVTTGSSGTIDEEGWLWRNALDQEAPPMSSTLATALDRKLDRTTLRLLLVVAPSGAGKSFGAWQLGTMRHVDLLDAVPNGKESLFARWKQAVMEDHIADKFLLLPDETVDDVLQVKRNSRKANVHTWILLYALATMRMQCEGPRDWLFMQRHRSGLVLAGYEAALAAFLQHPLPYSTMKHMAQTRLSTPDATAEAVLVVDEASHAMPNGSDLCLFARLKHASPTRTPAATPRDPTGRPADGPSVPAQACAALEGAGAGAGAGAGRGGAGCGGAEHALSRGTSTPDSERKASRTGLLGCLLQGAMAVSHRMIAMGTSFTFGHASELAQSGSDHPLYSRSTHEPRTPYMDSKCFPLLSAEDCASYIEFYAKLLDIQLDANALHGVCQQLQGRPSFVHYFIMCFVRHPGPDVAHIWSHGYYPKPDDAKPDCGAKQLLFSRLCTHYSTVLRTLDGDLKNVLFELLRMLAARHVFGDPTGELWLPTGLATNPFDFTEAGVAYLEPEGTATGAYVIREPLAVELAAYLGSQLDKRPMASQAWELLLMLHQHGTGATGHTLEPLVATFFVASNMQLREWLQQLHAVVCCTELVLPGWCDTPITFADLSRTCRDGESRVRVAFNMGSKAVGGVTVKRNEVHVVISPPMLTTAFVSVPWAKDAEQLLYQAGISPLVRLLEAEAAKNMLRHVRGIGKDFSKAWAAAVPRLRDAYDSTDPATRDSVASVVGIIDSQVENVRLRNTLFREDNVAIWSFGNFTFTERALVAFTGQQKRAAPATPKRQQTTNRKKKKARKSR